MIQSSTGETLIGRVLSQGFFPTRGKDISAAEIFIIKYMRGINLLSH